MKRSSAVNLILLTSAAATITACGEKPTRYCVDASNQVVAEADCVDHKDGRHSGDHWYYGGGHGAIVPGTRLSGGSTEEPSEGFSTPSGSERGVVGEAGEHAAGHGDADGGSGHGGGGEGSAGE